MSPTGIGAPDGQSGEICRAGTHAATSTINRTPVTWTINERRRDTRRARPFARRDRESSFAVAPDRDVAVTVAMP
jgi:hypothetical protein